MSLRSQFSQRFMGHVFAGTHAHKAHKFDIPLHNRLGTEFLVMLVALMTSLSLLAALGGLSLGHLTHKWTSGLENSLTIEIPSGDMARQHADRLLEALRTTPGITKAESVSTKDMARILAPWLGGDEAMLADIPLPILITVELEERSDSILAKLTTLTRRIAPESQMDAHEEWLSSLVKLTGTLRYIALAIFVVIVGVTGIVVAGAVRARMAIHQRELQLLHVMGAADSYIARQFVRYVFWQAGKGALIGMAIGFAVILSLVFVSPSSTATLPNFIPQLYDWVAFLLVPILLLGIAMLSARRTSLQVLREMP